MAATADEKKANLRLARLLEQKVYAKHKLVLRMTGPKEWKADAVLPSMADLDEPLAELGLRLSSIHALETDIILMLAFDGKPIHNFPRKLEAAIKKDGGKGGEEAGDESGGEDVVRIEDPATLYAGLLARVPEEHKQDVKISVFNKLEDLLSELGAAPKAPTREKLHVYMEEFVIDDELYSRDCFACSKNCVCPCGTLDCSCCARGLPCCDTRYDRQGSLKLRFNDKSDAVVYGWTTDRRGKLESAEKFKNQLVFACDWEDSLRVDVDVVEIDDSSQVQNVSRAFELASSAVGIAKQGAVAVPPPYNLAASLGAEIVHSGLQLGIAVAELVEISIDSDTELMYRGSIDLNEVNWEDLPPKSELAEVYEGIEGVQRSSSVIECARGKEGGWVGVMLRLVKLDPPKAKMRLVDVTVVKADIKPSLFLQSTFHKGLLAFMCGPDDSTTSTEIGLRTTQGWSGTFANVAKIDNLSVFSMVVKADTVPLTLKASVVPTDRWGRLTSSIENVIATTATTVETTLAKVNELRKTFAVHKLNEEKARLEALEAPTEADTAELAEITEALALWEMGGTHTRIGRVVKILESLPDDIPARVGTFTTTALEYLHESQETSARVPLMVPEIPKGKTQKTQRYCVHLVASRSTSCCFGCCKVAWWNCCHQLCCTTLFSNCLIEGVRRITDGMRVLICGCGLEWCNLGPGFKRLEDGSSYKVHRVEDDAIACDENLGNGVSTFICEITARRTNTQ